MLQQRSHFRQYAGAIGSASPPTLVAPLYLKTCILFECIRHELLKGGEELRVVSHLPRRRVDPGDLKDRGAQMLPVLGGELVEGQMI